MPRQFRLTRDRLEASIVLGSFGSTQPSITNNVFQVEFAADADTKLAVYKPQERYGKKEEIHHIFREDAKSPPMAISAIFSLLVMATVPAAVIGVRFPHSIFACVVSLTECAVGDYGS
mgnify:CR=1 FL=1